jgi:hypothetical protein
MSLAGTFMLFGLVKSTQVRAMSPALSERKNTTCSGVIPLVMMTLVVEAFMPKSMVATRAKMTPSVGFFWVN